MQIDARLLIGAAVLVTTMLLAPVPAAARAPSPAPGPQLSIAMDNGKTSVKPGEQLDYEITVTNQGGTAVEDVTLTQQLPPGVSVVSAGSGGRRQGQQVTWTVDVKPTAKAAVQVRLKAPAKPPAELLRLATVVCAQVTSKGPPLVCASDSDQLPAGAAAQAATAKTPARPVASAVQRPWVAGGVALTAGLLVAVLLRRRRA